MKAITEPQPGASLVALGVRTMLTRSWPAPVGLIGQPLAIHAGAKRPSTYWQHHVNDDVPDVIDLVSMSRYWEWCENPNDYTGPHAYRWVGPLGAVVATAVLTDCAPIGGPTSFRTGTFEGDEGDYPGQAVVVHHPSLFSSPEYLCIDCPKRGHVDITDQLPYGDFTPGRWAWLLGDVKPTTERCPACWGSCPGCNRAPIFPHNTLCTGRCSTCDGAGGCPPIPAKGRQRVWEWTL